jgi:CRISPR/Cas system-associated protein Csx1
MFENSFSIAQLKLRTAKLLSIINSTSLPLSTDNRQPEMWRILLVVFHNGITVVYECPEVSEPSGAWDSSGKHFFTIRKTANRSFALQLSRYFDTFASKSFAVCRSTHCINYKSFFHSYCNFQVFTVLIFLHPTV